MRASAMEWLKMCFIENLFDVVVIHVMIVNTYTILLVAGPDELNE